MKTEKRELYVPAPGSNMAKWNEEIKGMNSEEYREYCRQTTFLELSAQFAKYKEKKKAI